MVLVFEDFEFLRNVTPVNSNRNLYFIVIHKLSYNGLSVVMTNFNLLLSLKFFIILFPFCKGLNLFSPTYLIEYVLQKRFNTMGFSKHTSFISKGRVSFILQTNIKGSVSCTYIRISFPHCFAVLRAYLGLFVFWATKVSNLKRNAVWKTHG